MLERILYETIKRVYKQEAVSLPTGSCFLFS